MVSLIALDEILGFFFGRVMGVALERYVGNDFLHDSTANSEVDPIGWTKNRQFLDGAAG
jgi:hypothetical protein